MARISIILLLVIGCNSGPTKPTDNANPPESHEPAASPQAGVPPDTALEKLETRYQEMWDRLDGSYYLPE